ncbi:phosphopantetheine-binding protein [Phytomonospora sp. NPDC050363]|uniref:acyl carrier protein n=1 Tax=Phytomonospora sp. NPDC050363 TaxID=3155642 RepID=UPI0033EE28F7
MNLTRPSLDAVADILVGKLDVEREAIGPDVPMGELAVDSLAVVELTLQLKDSFGVTIEEEEIGLVTVAGLVELIESRDSRE